jgi:hypothetical protein
VSTVNISHTCFGIATVIFFCWADALIVVATETIATAANPTIILPIMVLVPVSGHAPQPLNTKLNSSNAVARVRQYRAVLKAILPGERAGRDLRNTARLRTMSTQTPG